jgi:isopenicillin-N N-acyltransferase-like protein
MTIDSIPSLTVGQDPVERGRLHGTRFANQIADNLITYLLRFEASGLSRDNAMAEGQEWFHATGGHNEAYAAEMVGIAEASGLDVAAIAVLNARYEIAFTLFGKDAACKERAQEELLSVVPDGCTTFALEPGVTATPGSARIGTGWKGCTAALAFFGSVGRTAPVSFASLGPGLSVARWGVNDRGIGLVENGRASSHDGKYPFEKPFHMRCREVLDAEVYEDALRPIVETRRTCSANFVIGHADGEIMDLETSPDLVTYIAPDEGIITHSNHFVTQGHGESQMEKIAPSTLYRASRLRRLLSRSTGSITLEDMKAAASDHFGVPNAICRHLSVSTPPSKRSMTTGAVLIDLKEMVMHVANGPPCTYPYVPFRIDEF